MADINWNKNVWDGKYDWVSQGEEWSNAWGGSVAQWFGSLYPRIHSYLDCSNILEIACGYGRWTRFLLPHCKGEYRAVDLSSQCIKFCQSHFKDYKNSFYKNDGLSLKQVSDMKYDFIFSFDSLVHVNVDTLNSYIVQCLNLLSDNGVAFIHHTNFNVLHETGLPKDHLGFTHMRDTSVSAKKVKNMIEKLEGKVLVQEVIDWGGVDDLDCLTVFVSKGYKASDTEYSHIVNRNFMLEAETTRTVHSKYFKPR
jgi:SAM-dependent methyltransferase